MARDWLHTVIEDPKLIATLSSSTNEARGGLELVSEADEVLRIR